jgi:hypothetical protein
LAAAATLSRARSNRRAVKVAITLNPGDAEALGDALDLAQALVSQSEYGDNRDQERRERRVVREAKRLYNRLAAANLAAFRRALRAERSA